MAGETLHTAEHQEQSTTVVMDDNFVVGQPVEDVPGGGGLDENPLG